MNRLRLYGRRYDYLDCDWSRPNYEQVIADVSSSTTLSWYPPEGVDLMVVEGWADDPDSVLQTGSVQFIGRWYQWPQDDQRLTGTECGYRVTPYLPTNRNAFRIYLDVPPGIWWIRSGGIQWSTASTGRFRVWALRESGRVWIDCDWRNPAVRSTMYGDTRIGNVKYVPIPRGAEWAACLFMGDVDRIGAVAQSADFLIRAYRRSPGYYLYLVNPWKSLAQWYLASGQRVFYWQGPIPPGITHIGFHHPAFTDPGSAPYGYADWWFWRYEL